MLDSSQNRNMQHLPYLCRPYPKILKVNVEHSLLCLGKLHTAARSTKLKNTPANWDEQKPSLYSFDLGRTFLRGPLSSRGIVRYQNHMSFL